MPELPEVQTIVNDLSKAKILHCAITKIDVNYPATIAKVSIPDFKKNLVGNEIVNIYRRGKWLVFVLKKGFIVVHLRMTGRFHLYTGKEPYTKHEHVGITFANGMQLRFHDTRKFGRWYLVDDPGEVLGQLGPEPLTWDAKAFTLALQRKSRQLKPLLLDQEFIAGIGNIYVDEALWEAKLNPKMLSSDVTKKQAENLFEGIQKVLKRGIDTLGTSLGKGKTNYYRLEGTQGEHQTRLNVFRRTGKPCPRCGMVIKRIVVAQRSTHVCPHCQKLD